MIKVLIVDDSATARYHLRTALESDPAIQVVGEAENGEQLHRYLRSKHPDIVTMDIYLRHENGIELTSEIMSSVPVPILMVTGVDAGNPQTIFRALEAGALEVAAKLPFTMDAGYPAALRELLRLIKNLACVPVITKRNYQRRPTAAYHLPPDRSPESQTNSGVVVIGASTGGPPVLRDIFKGLRRGKFGPVVVVQHIANGFAGGLARWLADESGHEVVVVDRPVAMQAGMIYLAVDDHHLVFTSPNTLAAIQSVAVRSLRPCADILFASAAKYATKPVLGIVLTGMGRDGADGFQKLAAAGAKLVVQQKDSCIVSSMPEQAKKRVPSAAWLSPSAIAKQITDFYYT